MERRSSIKIMTGLIKLIRPLILFMLLAVIMGCLGNLAAIFITVLGGYGMLSAAGIEGIWSLQFIFGSLVVLAAARGILRYAEQASNHYIAFRLLARIRHQVFHALRKLAPAKLDGSGKGNLIAIITSDIELLEVFYAHTISPIMIAIVTSGIMIWFLGSIHIFIGAAALIFYSIVGVVIPVWNGNAGKEKGIFYRNKFGELNTTVLDNLYGLSEILQFASQKKRLAKMEAQTDELEEARKSLKKGECIQTAVTDGVILLAGAAVLLLSYGLVKSGQMESAQMIPAVIGMMSSFGPVTALAALSNNLNQTLASGERVLHILEETPVTEEIKEGAEKVQGDIYCSGVDFAYPGAKERPILKQFYARFEEKKIYGIWGKSGCGKSTLLKLLMRFYEPDQGQIHYGEEDVSRIKTGALRKHVSYVTQETFLFQDTIENNIKVANLSAGRKAVEEAAKKASVHEFILSLPKGYDTTLSELGSSVSGGERQRIGLARAFLHGSQILFLDEPTSNVDSLNEGIILRSLEKEKEERTVVLVSHRKSAMGIADEVAVM